MTLDLGMANCGISTGGIGDAEIYCRPVQSAMPELLNPLHTDCHATSPGVIDAAGRAMAGRFGAP